MNRMQAAQIEKLIREARDLLAQENVDEPRKQALAKCLMAVQSSDQMRIVEQGGDERE